MKSYGKHFFGIYLLTYAAIGALLPLVAQYLHGIGFSGSQIGIITASSTAIGIFSNSYLGGLYHRLGRSKRVILFLCLATAASSLLLMTIKTFWLFLFLYVIVFFFENPIYPLIDSTVMEVDYPFGAARKWGCVGFASGIGVAGVVADKIGLISIFPMFACAFLLTALLIGVNIKNTNSMNNTNNVLDLESENYATRRGDGAKRTETYGDLIQNKKYLFLLLSTFFFAGPALSHNTYFSFLYLEAGGTIAGMGIVLLLMAASETPIMALVSRISSVITTERAVLAAMVISTIRFLWYSTAPSYEIIAATFLLQGLANGIGLVAIVNYIAKLAGAEMVSLAIPLYTAVSSNCGAITCQLIGGILVEYYGGWGVYLFYGLLNLAGVLIYVVTGLHKPSKKIQ